MKQDELYWEIAQRGFGVYSQEDQTRIKNGKVAIVGVGCDGGMNAYILTRMGVGKLGLIDFDINELSNMNRQPMATYLSIGIPKVYAAKAICKNLNPTVEVDAINEKITEENAEELLRGYDVVLQCTDSVVARIVTARAAKRLGIPVVVMTGQPPFRSFVSTIMPDGPTYEGLFRIDFMAGKTFAENPKLKERINKLKYERARHASEYRAAEGWQERYENGEVGWGITPERAYLTSVHQSHEALRLLTGKTPNAIAPVAYISDLNGLGEFGHPGSLVMILKPTNGVNWDYRMF
ncbi:ThiF family adenylyltransferase [Candidatus Woesearchaeota archaeon]|nr:ThiF family adenylyltransferase [Candidatus Woesearchaeota archaeon]